MTVDTKASGPDESKMVQPDLNVLLSCSYCKNPIPHIVEDFAAGDLICGTCGLVLGNRIIDTRSEWRTFANSEENGDDPSRVGAAGDPLLGGADHLDSTVISHRDGSTGQSRELNRAQGKVGNVKAEKNLITAFKSLQLMGERVHLSRVVIDSAKQLFKTADDSKKFKGKSPEAVMAACIYVACRENNVTRTFKEICGLTNVSKKEIGRIYKAIHSAMDKPASQINYDSYISRFISDLNMQPDVRRGTLKVRGPFQRAFSIDAYIRTSYKVTEQVEHKGLLAGKSPITIVAACLYFTSQLASEQNHKSAREIARIAGCTEATLKNAYKHLYEARVALAKDLNLPGSVDRMAAP
ncbi:transcription initiation factor IIB [Borealophlyctis nickersoniae]|nr:transcription initiation factor IIB [Borealophlyctis nickersoniae]